jgi:hypothetical protein
MFQFFFCSNVLKLLHSPITTTDHNQQIYHYQTSVQRSLSIHNWGHPVVYVKTDIGKNRWTQQKLFIICYSRQLVSTQLWGHHPAINKNRRNEMYMKVTYALRDPVQTIAHIIPSVCTTTNINRTGTCKAHVTSMYISFLQFLFIAWWWPHSWVETSCLE